MQRERTRAQWPIPQSRSQQSHLGLCLGLAYIWNRGLRLSLEALSYTHPGIPSLWSNGSVVSAWSFGRAGENPLCT